MHKPVVLLVEDDSADQEILKRAVSSGALNVELRVASDGREALDQLLGEGAPGASAGLSLPDLVLLDLNMPGLNGLEVLERIRADKKTRSLPVVVLTTSDNAQDVLKSYELGANSFLTKPASFQDFVDLMRELGRYWFGCVVLPQPEPVF